MRGAEPLKFLNSLISAPEPIEDSETIFYQGPEIPLGFLFVDLL